MKIETYGRNPNIYQPLERNVVFANVWARVPALHEQEYYTAVSVKLEKQLSSTVRYRPDIDEETNIWFDGRGHSIGFIDNAKYRGKYLGVKANYSKGVRPPNED